MPGKNKEAGLLAGMIIAVELDKAGAAGVYSTIDGLLNFGAIGEIGEAKSQTTLVDKTKRYGPAMKDTSEQSLKFNHYTDNLVQESYINAANQRKLVGILAIYPSGRQAKFDLNLLGFTMDEAASGEDWETFTTPARQSGETEWVEPSKMPSPDAIVFTAATLVAVKTKTTSAGVTITGLSSPTTIAVSGGTYTINGGDETSDVGIVKTGDIVTITLTSSPAGATAKSAFVNVGGVIGTFTVTTAA